MTTSKARAREPRTQPEMGDSINKRGSQHPLSPDWREGPDPRTRERRLGPPR